MASVPKQNTWAGHRLREMPWKAYTWVNRRKNNSRDLFYDNKNRAAGKEASFREKDLWPWPVAMSKHHVDLLPEVADIQA